VDSDDVQILRIADNLPTNFGHRLPLRSLILVDVRVVTLHLVCEIYIYIYIYIYDSDVESWVGYNDVFYKFVAIGSQRPTPDTAVKACENRGSAPRVTNVNATLESANMRANRNDRGTMSVYPTREHVDGTNI
jgi:hypothetical protein